MPATAVAAPPAVRPRLLLGTMLAVGCVAGVALAALLEGGRVLFGPNFHAVIPGAVYRCSQPSGEWLAAAIRAYGIRTVINLRGCCDPEAEYLDECRATARLGVSQEDIGFSSGRLPPVPSVRELVRVLDGSDKPVLFHCHKGIDRTGMASALALLLYTDKTPEEARRQLGLRFAHVPFGRTGNMDRFFDLYSEWLTANGLRHSRSAFRRWLEQDYCAGECRAAIELAGPRAGPLTAPRGRPFGVRVRCTNTSVKPWEMRPGNNAGVHALWSLADGDDRPVATGRSGLFRAGVAPGESVELTLALPALRSGRYHLFVDMEDERHAKFFQVGSEPLFAGLEVP
jgi:protein tyrosine/serine phosphatase